MAWAYPNWPKNFDKLPADIREAFELDEASAWTRTFCSGGLTTPRSILPFHAAAYNRRTCFLAVQSLPMHHRDPFDRMLVAQAHVEGMTIVTRDPKVLEYAVRNILA